MIGDLKFLTALRKHNPNLQILVSLRPSSNQFSLEDTSTLTPTALTVRKKFASRVRDFITRHGLDGVDLDWSYFKDPQNSNSKRETLISVLRVSTSVLSLFFTLNNFLSLTHFMHSFYFIIKYFNIFQTVIAQ